MQTTNTHTVATLAKATTELFAGMVVLLVVAEGIAAGLGRAIEYVVQNARRRL